MNCSICKRETQIGWTLSWSFIDKKEYEQRKTDGRTTKLHDVCSNCYELFYGKPPLGLRDHENMRKNKQTEEQYYKSMGY